MADRIGFCHSERSEEPAVVLDRTKTGSSAYGLGMTVFVEDARMADRFSFCHSERSEEPAVVLVTIKTGSSAFGLGMAVCAEGRKHG